jgi:hypothetical protein
MESAKNFFIAVSDHDGAQDASQNQKREGLQTIKGIQAGSPG